MILRYAGCGSRGPGGKSGHVSGSLPATATATAGTLFAAGRQPPPPPAFCSVRQPFRMKPPNRSPACPERGCRLFTDRLHTDANGNRSPACPERVAAPAFWRGRARGWWASKRAVRRPGTGGGAGRRSPGLVGGAGRPGRVGGGSAGAHPHTRARTHPAGAGYAPDLPGFAACGSRLHHGGGTACRTGMPRPGRSSRFIY